MRGTPVSWRVSVRGRVQGVFYRAFTRGAADRLGVTGWVQNEPDGSVSALIQHSERRILHQMLATMSQGPPESVVESVQYEVVREAAEYESFSIER